MQAFNLQVLLITFNKWHTWQISQLAVGSQQIILEDKFDLVSLFAIKACFHMSHLFVFFPFGSVELLSIHGPNFIYHILYPLSFPF